MRHIAELVGYSGFPQLTPGPKNSPEGSATGAFFRCLLASPRKSRKTSSTNNCSRIAPQVDLTPTQSLFKADRQ